MVRFAPRFEVKGRAHTAAILVFVVLLIAAAVLLYFGRPGKGGGQFYTVGPSRSAPTDVSRAVAKVAPAVVRIDTAAGGTTEDLLRGLFGGSPEDIFPRRGQGSGIIVSARRGYVLTNAHVARGARQMTVTLPNGRAFEGRLLGADSLTDIAVVQIRGRDLPQVELGSSSRLPVGSWVIAVGNPLGLQNSVTAGVLSAKGRSIAGQSGLVTDLLQTDAAINAGNSGGALIDLRGQVVGMPTAIIPYAQGIGFAVAIDTAKEVIPELVREGKVRHAWLGVGSALRPEQGQVVIEQVVPGSPAARAGLKPGDIVLQAGGRPLRREDDLPRVVRTKRPGDSLQLVILRRGARQTVTVRLTERPRSLD